MTEERRHDDRRQRERRFGSSRYGSRRTDDEGGVHIYILPKWVRVWHWTNAILIITLIVTGVSLHFADSKVPLVEFPLAVRIHNIAGVALVLLYTGFVIGNALTGNWWQFIPKPPNVFQRCVNQVRYYMWGVFKGEHEPYPVTEDEHFNALQSLTYWFVIYMVLPVIVVTGLIFLYPQFAPARMFGVDGLFTIAVLHYMSATVIAAFIVAHIYLCTFGKKISSTFKTMITGWHEH
ncbi:thiosulfate reductase cytochrome B subunit [Niveibacterium umoris]|uniref:Thiosulfate reductase cytochrome b subunit n=1 Tax=Niveibacterium umoris TaxID=1193620 RepID=A0A840BR56_9RHOO|nr:cytochrome b/b6 domain-containing protein [Niveibacterium umoris]MBB4014152.1 thiosulfate reductase cytochrome b subunit [Niveibacterium umoris]